MVKLNLKSITLYQDDKIWVINKPAGILSVKPSYEPQIYKERDIHTLLIEYTKRELFPVNRIDKNVSGVLLFAKEREVHKELCRLFAKRLVEKKYLAIIHGTPNSNEFKVSKKLRRTSNGPVLNPNGKEYAIVVTKLEEFIDASLVEVISIGGLRHQVRFLLSLAGFPIVGDTLYGGKPLTPYNKERIMLHFMNLRFTLNDKNYNFICPPPIEICRTLKYLERKRKKMLSLLRIKK